MSGTTRSIAVAFGVAVSGTPAWAECAQKVTVNEMAQQISLGDAAFADMDDTGFSQARTTTIQAIPCLSDGVTSTQAAALYRLQALGAFLDQDHASAVNSFQSLLAVAPGYLLPETLAPDGHPLRLYFHIASGMPSIAPRIITIPREGWIHVDGKASDTVPVDRPYLFQYFDASGAVAKTALVQPGLTPPDYPAKSTRLGGGSGDGLKIHVPLALTAGVAAVAAGGLYLAASGQESQFWDATTPQADLQTIRTRANTLGWMSTGVGAVAVGAGVAAVVVGTW